MARCSTRPVPPSISTTTPANGAVTQRVDVDDGARPRLDDDLLLGRRTVRGEDAVGSHELLVGAVGDDHLAADAVLTGRRDTGTEPTPGERAPLVDRRHPGACRRREERIGLRRRRRVRSRRLRRHPPRPRQGGNGSADHRSLVCGSDVVVVVVVVGSRLDGQVEQGLGERSMSVSSVTARPVRRPVGT